MLHVNLDANENIILHVNEQLFVQEGEFQTRYIEFYIT